jgi:rhomboid protease GluP
MILGGIYILLYLLPAATEALLLSPVTLFSGEIWRILTYQFVHQNLQHLVENLIALLLSALIAIELKAEFSVYSMTYFLTGVLAILPLWFISPFIALGASSAIYGSLGYLSRTAKKFEIRPSLLIGAIILLTLVGTIITYLTTSATDTIGLSQQFFAHISGLLFGYYFCILVVLIKDRYAEKRLSCLQNV